MNKQKFLDFIKSLTIAKLLRWGIKSGIFLWGVFLIITGLIGIYNIIKDYNDIWHDYGKGDIVAPKKYICFLVPQELFNIFFSCYFITDIWHRKNNLYLFTMLVIFFIVIDVISSLNHHLIFATTFWR